MIVSDIRSKKNKEARRRRREQCFKNQKCKCVFCGKSTFLFRISHPDSRMSHPRLATLEHVITCRDKNRTMDFLAMACFECNNDRGSKPLDKFLGVEKARRIWDLYYEMLSEYVKTGQSVCANLADGIL